MLNLKLRLRFYLHGISRHSLEEMNEFSFKDLKAISDCLGKKSSDNHDIRCIYRVFHDRANISYAYFLGINGFVSCFKFIIGLF